MKYVCLVAKFSSFRFVIEFVNFLNTWQLAARINHFFGSKLSIGKLSGSVVDPFVQTLSVIIRHLVFQLVSKISNSQEQYRIFFTKLPLPWELFNNFILCQYNVSYRCICQVAYQRILQLSYVDKFLSDIQMEFR